MTGQEKLEKVKEEFAREGFRVSVEVDGASPWGGSCKLCGASPKYLLQVWRSRLPPKALPPKPEKPSKGGKKARDEWNEELIAWEIETFKRDAELAFTRFDTTFFCCCPDRPACNLRAAKKRYKDARRLEKEERRKSGVVRV